MNFGAAFYCKQDLAASPDLAITLLRLLAELGKMPVFFQGILARSDKFTRPIELSTKSEEQLKVDLRGGVYSDFVAFLGERREPTASIAIGFPLNAAASSAHLGTLYLTLVLVSAGEAPRAIELTDSVWSIVEPAYGLSVWGRTFTEVFSEIHMTPISDWRAPPDLGKESRLLSLQRRRQLIGAYARSAAWGNYLGGDLVGELGGFEAIQQSAPVSTARPVAGGGAYLQMASDPLYLGTPAYEAAASRLEEYLRPILLPN